MLSLRRHRGLFAGSLLLFLLVVVIWSCTRGAVQIPTAEIVTSVGRKLGFVAHAGTPTQNETVLWQLRVPRVLLSTLVGATLAVAGALMQGLFRNPLAEPSLIGVSSGAALGAVIAIVFGAELALYATRIVVENPLWGNRLLGLTPYFQDTQLIAVCSLVGGYLATMTVLRLSIVGGVTSVATLLLTGIAVNALAGAAIAFCTFAASDTQLRSLTFWMMGSFSSATWQNLGHVLPFCLGLLVISPGAARALNAMALGESEAAHLGFRPERARRWLILLTCLGVGACVTVTGMIGFVGLVIPHLVRLLIGPDHRWLIPCSGILGAAMLTLGDTFARTIVAPAEMPIGIITALIGAPFFLGLLWRQRHAGAR